MSIRVIFNNFIKGCYKWKEVTWWITRAFAGLGFHIDQKQVFSRELKKSVNAALEIYWPRHSILSSSIS